MRTLFALPLLAITLLGPRQNLAQENQALPHDQANKSTEQQENPSPVPPRQTSDGVGQPNASPEQKSKTNHYERPAVNKLSWIPIVINAIYVIVSGLTLFFIYRQARHMRESVTLAQAQVKQASRQADLIQKQLEFSERPWIAVDIAPASQLIVNERGATLMLNVTMKNVGHSVARYFSLWTEFVVAGVHDLNQVQEKLSNIMKDPVNAKRDYGWLLFPGQSVTESRPVIAALKDIEQALETGRFKIKKAFAF